MLNKRTGVGGMKPDTCPVLEPVEVCELGRKASKAMEYPVKICPRCKAQLQQGDGAFELVRRGTTGSEHFSGLSVAVYFCPKCGYIELYDLKVIGRI